MNEELGKIKIRREEVSFINVFILLSIIFVTLSILIIPGASTHRRGRHTPCLNNVRNLGLAVINYASQHSDYLPTPYLIDEHNQPLHSWRTNILPNFDNAALHHEYHFEVPWDHPENDFFRTRHINGMNCPSSPEYQTNGTSYFVIVGQNTPFPEQSNGPQRVTTNEISMGDGISQTIMITEATGWNVDWNEPVEIAYWKIESTNQVVRPFPSTSHGNSFNAFFVDGHSCSISKDIDPLVLKALATYNGGEEISDGDW